jgi:hypothetical protein
MITTASKWLSQRSLILLKDDHLSEQAAQREITPRGSNVCSYYRSLKTMTIELNRSDNGCAGPITC